MTTRADMPIPGLLWGDYPERTVDPQRVPRQGVAWLRSQGDRLGDLAGTLFGQGSRRWLARVRATEADLADAPLDTTRVHVRASMLRDGLTGTALIRAVALVSLTARRQLGVEPFDTQLIAARAVLDGQLAEMATGEGKTLAVGLAAAVAALAGIPVHVVTANDYLVARDADTLRPLYEALGLRAGRIVQADGPAERCAAYACDITYVTAKELVFDYLRDALTGAPGRRRRDAPARPLARLQASSEAPPLLRGLCMAIVDEADAILIDEARVPLILSQRADKADEHRHARQALEFARALTPKVDFTLLPAAMAAELTDKGRLHLMQIVIGLTDPSVSAAWRNRLHREHAVSTALAALHLYHAERHYLVREGQVVIVDPNTGRVAEGRAWSRGLQQAVEIKEGCEPSHPMVTLAQLTYQRFFPRYVRLGGLSGTLLEARSELMATYGRSVRRIPLRRPERRHVGATRLLADHTALWQAVADRIGTLRAREQPVLVATDSVADAQALAEVLTMRGWPHAVLHARNDHEEAAIVARAGQRGAITVTTNLAGRGTDIALGDGVARLGGLHVICCQLNGARRIDRQLAGRAARQGDPGSVETMLSLETALIARSLPRAVNRLLQRCARWLPSWLVRGLARGLQRAEESRHRTERRRLIAEDERSERALGFGGRSE